MDPRQITVSRMDQFVSGHGEPGRRRGHGHSLSRRCGGAIGSREAASRVARSLKILSMAVCLNDRIGAAASQFRPHPVTPITLRSGASMFPSANCITLHPRQADAWGVPIPRLRLAITDNERELMRAQVQGLSREQSRWSVASFEARVSCPSARPMDDACAGSRANQATAARRSRSRCLIDAVVAAPVLMVSLSTSTTRQPRHRSCSGDFHDPSRRSASPTAAALS